MNLKDKVIVITGGSKGLGKALASLFVKEGSIVVISSHNQNDLETTAKEINATAIVADITKEQEVKDLAEQVVKDYGRIDIWINNAGVLYRFPKGELIDMGRVHQMFDVNIMGTVFGCQTALTHMEHSENSLILNIVSTAGLDATRAKKSKLYATSKWAQRGFLQAFKFENSDSKIKFINVYPGGIQTDLWKGLDVENFAGFMTPEYVAGLVIENIKKENPEEELIIKRPTA